MEEASGNPAMEVMVDVAALEIVDMKCKGGTVRESKQVCLSCTYYSWAYFKYDPTSMFRFSLEQSPILISIQFCFRLCGWINLLYSIFCLLRVFFVSITVFILFHQKQITYIMGSQF